MLPSTFENKLKKEEELKKRIGVKLEVARFLQVLLPPLRWAQLHLLHRLRAAFSFFYCLYCSKVSLGSVLHCKEACFYPHICYCPAGYCGRDGEEHEEQQDRGNSGLCIGAL